MADYIPLRNAFRQAFRCPSSDLESALGTLPDAEYLPSPWVTWTLIGLSRHRRRQLWVAEIVEERLETRPEALARRGVLAHPSNRPPEGLVPGLTEWEYHFHGRGCCLTHRGTGERIDVDFFGPTGEFFDPFFYLNYLKSLHDPEAPEARLIGLHPSFEPIELAIIDLLEAGFLVPREPGKTHCFRVAEHVVDEEALIDAFCTAWQANENGIWLAASIGDWPLAHELAIRSGNAALVAQTAARAAICETRRCHDLLKRWDDETLRGAALLGLDDINAAALPEQLDRALKRPACGVTSRALQILDRRNDAAWCEPVYHLFRRLNPSAEPPEPHLWVKCQEFLLRHGYRMDRMRKALDRADGMATADAALLALEYAPERALRLFRRALRSHIPASRSRSAAILALIDRPWSRRELLAILRESHDQEATSACRAALLECHDANARQAVSTWESMNPHEPEVGRWMTMREVALRDCAAWIQYEMERLHDRVMKIRDREPVD